MKGLIDGLLLFLNFGQIGNYSRNLFENLLKYNNTSISIIKDYEINSNLFTNNSVELLIDRSNNNYKNLSKYLQSNNFNFYHCLNNGFSIPKDLDFNYIMNISNLTPLFFEDFCNENYLNNFFNKLPYALIKSNAIICPSISSKKDLLQYFSIDEDIISICYGVISDFFCKIDKFMASIYLKSRFNINNDFIIFYGDFNKKKSLDKAILLFSKIRKILPDIYFFICSDKLNDIKYLNELKKLSQSLNIFDYVFYLENLSVIDKVNLFNKALFFIDLSIYENVNLNIIEAFCCETPIICSPISLYKEYFGDFCFYYNDNIDYISVINYIKRYCLYNKDFIISKFDTNLNLEILRDIYDRFS